MEDTKFWVALARHEKIGSRTIMKLFKNFKVLARVWESKEDKLALAGLDAAQIKAVLEVVSKVDPDSEMARLEKHKIKVLVYPEENYPKMLKEIPDPPALIFIRGQLDPHDEIALAVVGSRKATSYGERVIEELVGPLAQSGLTIVSGLALGIDALAHRATLDAHGRTIAVLGCGLDQVYPTSNIRLADQILASGGAIISEFPLGRAAMKFNFPIRNRIIAGLSLGTLVIEAAIESGSLITAQAALEYNREVFAIPGPINSEMSAGPNHLIQIGAKLVTSADDILADLNLENTINAAEARQIIPDTPEERVVLEALTEPVDFDTIVRLSGLTSSLVNSVLVMLEIKGMVKNLGGAMYVRRGKLR